MAEIEKEKAVARERTAEDEKLLAEWNAKRDQARVGRERRPAASIRTRDQSFAAPGSPKCAIRSAWVARSCCVRRRTTKCATDRSSSANPASAFCTSIRPPEWRMERPSLTAKRRARPKTHVDKAWFYRAEYGDLGEVFFAFLNADGSSSRRVYDAHTGRKHWRLSLSCPAISALFSRTILNPAFAFTPRWICNSLKSGPRSCP